MINNEMMREPRFLSPQLRVPRLPLMIDRRMRQSFVPSAMASFLLSCVLSCVLSFCAHFRSFSFSSRLPHCLTRKALTGLRTKRRPPQGKTGKVNSRLHNIRRNEFRAHKLDIPARRDHAKRASSSFSPTYVNIAHLGSLLPCLAHCSAQLGCSFLPFPLRYKKSLSRTPALSRAS